MEISNKAAQAIVYAINFHLEDLGLDHVPQARALAIQVAADVKRIMAKEPEFGIADVYHSGTKSYYRARLLKKLTPKEYYFDPTEEFGG